VPEGGIALAKAEVQRTDGRVPEGHLRHQDRAQRRIGAGGERATLALECQ